MANYFNTLFITKKKLTQLGQCRFYGHPLNLPIGVALLKGKKIVDCRLWSPGPKSRFKYA